MIRKIKKCRICGNQNLEPIVHLGNFHLTGVFPTRAEEEVTSGPLELVKCEENGTGKTCGLLQLNHSYNLDELYGACYGYRSGINQTMRDHLRKKVKNILEIVTLKSGDVVLDIGSNDGTLLNSYAPERDITLIGVDPSAEKYRTNYPSNGCLIVNFFTADVCRSHLKNRKAKVVTTIAMFYDLEDPLKFVSDVREILADDGVWVMEQSYMPFMIKQNAYDTICHEHLEYYGLRQIKWMIEKCGLKIVNVELNDINGGSFSVVLAKNNATLKANTANIDQLLGHEVRNGFDNNEPFLNFKNNIFSHREKMSERIQSIRSNKLSVYGYGASTKGNVILQFCGFTPKHICAIADRNPDKVGSFTPGTKIPIISEDEARRSNPEYFLVLPWHFRTEIVEREAEFLKRGGKLLFPLPCLEIVAQKGKINDVTTSELFKGV